MNGKRPKSLHLPFSISRFPSVAGVTLVELMIAVAIMSIALLGIVFGFAKMGKGLLVSKNTSAASNLAQEKIESLKNISYYRLMVSTPGTTATRTWTGETFEYDTNYYPPETIRVGGLNYTRYTYIKKKTETAGLLVDLAWNSADSGIKEATCVVIWSQGSDEKALRLVNLRNNPSRVGLGGTITGTIKDAGDSSLLSNCKVILQTTAGADQPWNTTTDGAGVYSLKVPTGAWQVKVTRSGYFVAISSSVTLATDATQSLSPTLNEMGKGSLTGWVARGDGLKIAAVCVSTTVDSIEYEFIELFNPTTWTIQIGSGTRAAASPYGGATDYFHLHYVDRNDVKTELELSYNVESIGPGQYYLIGSSSIIRTQRYDNASPIAVNAAAYYRADLSTDTVDDTIGGGIGLTLARYTAFDSPYEVWVDCVSWGIPGGGPTDNPPASCTEGMAIDLVSTPLVDRVAGNVLARLPWREGTLWGSLASDIFLYGSGWDNNRNGKSGSLGGDFNVYGLSDCYGPTYGCVASTWTSVTARHGFPMVGAIVSCSDGLSSPTTAYAEDMDPGAAVVNGSARFWLHGVATGTWTVTIASGSLAQFTEITLTQAEQDTTNYIRHWGNEGTSNSTGTYWTRLSSANSNGFISGRVTDSGGSGLASISVTGGVGASATTDLNGYYMMYPASPGTYTVTANEGNANASYTVGTTTGVEVAVGAITSGINFTLSAGGQVSGKLTTNGTDALPGVVIGAYTGGAGTTLVDSVVTDSAGDYKIQNLSANTYQVQPVLDMGESITSPAAGYEEVVVVAGSNFTGKNFQVASGWLKVTGSCEYSNDAITTGVLVYATTSTIASGNPPNLTYSGVAGVTRYMTISGSDGLYTLYIRRPTSGALTYYFYGYYTTQDANGVTTTDRNDDTMAVLSSESSRTKDWDWP